VLPAPSDSDRIIDAALACIGAQGWRRLSLADIAAEAGRRSYGSTGCTPRSRRSCAASSGASTRRCGRAAEGEPDERPRDRVFDLLMRRFDALQPHRRALDVLARELPTDPLAALAPGPDCCRSMRWMLEAAGISGEGLGGVVAVKLTAVAYLGRCGCGGATTRRTSRRPWRRSTAGCAASSAGTARGGGADPARRQPAPEFSVYVALRDNT